eukprot:5753756-Pyramimonas_sp.AAC.2
MNIAPVRGVCTRAGGVPQHSLATSTILRYQQSLKPTDPEQTTVLTLRDEICTSIGAMGQYHTDCIAGNSSRRIIRCSGSSTSTATTVKNTNTGTCGQMMHPLRSSPHDGEDSLLDRRGQTATVSYSENTDLLPLERNRNFGGSTLTSF